jgi:hypothetical protein
MTLEDVVLARAALVARGLKPSQRAILVELGRGSKRDVARYLHQLEESATPENSMQCSNGEKMHTPAAEPEPVDPVIQAEQRVQQAEQELAGAREHLIWCKVELLAMQPLRVDNLLRGSLHPHDECLAEALHDVESAKQTYDRAWQQREDARQQLAQLEKQHRRGLQERHVATHQPDLVAALDHWSERLRLATTDFQHAHAKKERDAANLAYQQAVARAPWTSNGTTAAVP